MDDQVFRLRNQTLELEVSDVYFITGLSRRGAVPILTGSRPSREKVGEVKARVCPEAQFGQRSAKVLINTIWDLTLKAILFTITRAARVQAPHEAIKNHLILATECLSPTIFNWDATVTTNIKRQLTNCNRADTKQFAYGSIVVSFFLE